MADFLSTDSPQQHPKDDVLERAEFSQEIARVLGTWRNSEAWVVSLTGEWGSGKTTIAYFIKHYLREEYSECLVADFNPWSWSGQDKLAEGFFWEISEQLGKKNKAKIYRRLARQWRTMGTTLHGLKLIHEKLPRWILLTNNLLTALGVTGVFALPGTWAKAGAALLALLSALASLGDLPEKLAKATESFAKEEPLEDLRDDIAKELENLKQPIIVFIDDIDRLTKEEIALLVQLVKSNTKLPNLIFVLLFQRNLVTRALGDVVTEDGDKYLRKIVQLEWETPLPREEKLMEMLFKGIDAILEKGNPKIEWDNDRWRLMVDDGIRTYFHNLRDIKRFLAGLEFHFRMQLHNNILEVNPLDLVAMEVLRLFENDVYLAIAREINWNKDLETRLRWSGRKTLDEMGAKMSSIIEQEGRPPARRGSVKVILEGLFPAFFGKPADENEVFGKMRICDAEHFHKYFRGTMDTKNPFAERWANFLAVMNDREAVARLLTMAIEEKHHEKVLAQLWARKDEIPLAAMLPVATALLDVSDRLPPAKLGFGDGFAGVMSVSRIIHHRLIGENPAVRSQLFKQALMNTTGFAGPLHMISLEAKDSRVRHPEYSHLLLEEEIPWMEAHGVSLIQKRAAQGLLLERPGEGFTLYCWKAWGSEEEMKAWVRQFASTPKNALTLLKRLAARSSSAGHEEPFLAGASIDELGGPEALKAQIDLIPVAELSDEDRLHVRLINRMVALKQAGEPYEEVRLRDSPPLDGTESDL